MLTPVFPSNGRSRARRRRRAVTAIGLVALLTLAACSKKDSTKSVESSSSPVVSSSAPAGEKVTVNWFVGLGTGADQGQPAKEKLVVDAFNASQSDITLKMTVVANIQAATTLATQVSGGNGPDLVGPVGIRGSNQFFGQWADLAPFIDSQKFDTSIFDKAQVEAQKDASGAQTALPFGVYPSFIWYNKTLFDDAGIAYPPHKFGDKYADGREWNTDTLRDLAKKLTVDAAGNDATSPKFNSAKIVQWGFNPQFGDTTITRHGTMFGAGALVGEDGKTANIPPNWLAEWKWRYDMVWKDHSAPNAKELASDVLNKGNAFQTGKIAMAYTHIWYLCCVKDAKDKALTFWDIAAMPSHDGKLTAALHSDSFRIMKGSKHPEAAFKVLSYFLTTAAPDLLKIYNAMPANQSLQDDYFANLDKTWTQKVDWQVAKDALGYPDVPNHESWTPNYLKAETRSNAFGTLMQTKPGLDIDAEAKKFEADLQKIYDEAKK